MIDTKEQDKTQRLADVAGLLKSISNGANSPELVRVESRLALAILEPITSQEPPSWPRPTYLELKVVADLLYAILQERWKHCPKMDPSDDPNELALVLALKEAGYEFPLLIEMQ